MIKYFYTGRIPNDVKKKQDNLYTEYDLRKIASSFARVGILSRNFTDPNMPIEQIRKALGSLRKDGRSKKLKRSGRKRSGRKRSGRKSPGRKSSGRKRSGSRKRRY